jgi:hypothetical protein
MVAHIRRMLAVFALVPAVVFAQQAPAKPETDKSVKTGTSDKDAKEVSGMSILGNQDAPKSLVIVPWKSSEIGKAMGVSTLLDDSKTPIDKEVFMRMLSYYEIRSETARPVSAPAEKTAAQPAAATQGRKK